MSVDTTKTRTVLLPNMEAIHFYSFFELLRVEKSPLNKSAVSRNVVKLMPVKLIYNPILETVQKEFSEKYAKEIESFQSESDEVIKKSKEVELLNLQQDYFENDPLLQEFARNGTEVGLQQIDIEFCNDGKNCPTYLLELLSKYDLIEIAE
jgi:hypothetical protein